MKSFINSMSILVFFLFCSSTLFAENIETSEHLASIAKNFITQNIQIAADESMEIQAFPANTQVAACNKEITAAFPKNSTTEQVTSIELTCNDANPWQIYVPVDIQVFTKVVIAKRTIPPKEILSEEDLDFAPKNKNRLYNGYYTSKEEIIGNESAHLITAGTVLTKKNIELPLLVHKNQAISIFAQSNAVLVTMQGIAKSDGAKDAVIKVYNPSSKRTLDAVVVGPNRAQVIA